MHADIKYEDGEFYLFDNNSKFGTLVLLKEPLEIKSETVFLQCGKTVVTLGLKQVKTKSFQIAQEVLEMQDSIGTPSTINNDNDVDNNAKQQLEKTTIKKRKGRPRKNVKPMALVDLKIDDMSVLNTNIEEENGENGENDEKSVNIVIPSLTKNTKNENKIMKNSRKIVKPKKPTK